MKAIKAMILAVFAVALIPQANAQSFTDIEPNGTCFSAQFLPSATLPIQVNGYKILSPPPPPPPPPGFPPFPVPDAVDFYKFFATPGTQLRVTLAGDTSKPNPLTAFGLGLFVPFCTGFPNVNAFSIFTPAHFEYTVPPDGISVIGVTACCDTNFSGSGTIEGAYVLTVESVGPPPPPPTVVEEGFIVGWGNNDFGQANVPMGDDFVQIAAGVYHSVALRADGSLVEFGYNDFGLENVPAGNNFVQVASGYHHIVALRANGSLEGWGRNDEGAATVPEGDDFVQVAGGGFHSLAIRADGSLVGWGYNDFGLANVPEGNDFVQIAAGGFHNLAIRADGSLVGWGYNGYGQANVPEGNDFVQIAAGTVSSVALRADGSLVGWPINDVPPGNDFVQISSTQDHNLALRADGSLVGFGPVWEEYNGLGNIPLGDIYFQIAAGAFHGLALSTVPLREAIPLTLWIGLKNSDDQGTQFDLKAELYKNNIPISIGKSLCITGVTRNPSLARETSVEFGPVFTRDFAPGDTLSLKVFTRIGTTPDGMKCSGPGGSHNNAVGLRAYYDSPTRPSKFSAEIPPYSLLTDLFLHSSGTNYFFDGVSPTGTVKYKDSGSVNFKNGNPWKEIGTWSVPVQ